MFSLFGNRSSKKSRSPEVRRRQQAKHRKLFVEGLEERRLMVARLDIDGSGANWTAAITDQAGDNSDIIIDYRAGGQQWEFFNNLGNFNYFINGVAQSGANQVISNIALTSITANLGDGSDDVLVRGASSSFIVNLNLPAATSIAINLGTAGEGNALRVAQVGGTTFNVTGAASGTFGPSGTFTGVDSLRGTSLIAATDTFDVTGAFAGTLDGFSGNDIYRIRNGGSVATISPTFFGGSFTELLIDENSNAAFTIGTGGTNGSSTGVGSFTRIDNLQGGTTANTFTFGATSKWNGGIDGAGGTDTIDVVAVGPVNVNPITATSGNILKVTDTPPTSTVLNAAGLTAFGSGYVNVESVLANATLTAAIVSGNLVVTDTAGVTNTMTVRLNGANLEITDATQQFVAAPAPGWTLSNNGRTLSIAAAIFLGQVNLNTAAGDDTVTVNIPPTGTFPQVNFDGGVGGQDRLNVNGGGRTNPTLNYDDTFTATDKGGNVVLGGTTFVTYVNLSPVALTNVAGILTFNLPNVVNPDAVVAFTAPNNVTLTGSTFEATNVSLVGITNVIVNGNTLADTITVDPTYNAGRPALDINGGDDIDNITVSAGAQARNINGGNGNNNIFVSGTVTGTITTGNGADTIIVQATGVVNGLIDSGDENDIVILRGTEAGVRLGNGNDDLRVEAGTAGAIQTGDAANNDTGSPPVPNNKVFVANGATVASITGASVNSAILINDSIQIDGNVTGNIVTLGGADEVFVSATGVVGGNIDGGDENDRFQIAGTVSAVIGGLGCDRLILIGATTTANVTAANSGNYINPVDAGPTPFSQIEAILGTAAGANTFNFSNNATLGGFIDGVGVAADPQDTLSFAGYSTGVNPSIVGLNQVNVAGILNIDPVCVAQFDAADPEDRTIGAASIENLTGSTFADTFTFQPGGKLTGTTGINGNGPIAPTTPGDTINTNFVAGTIYNVTGPNGTGNIVDPTAALPGTNFTNIETLNGNAATGDIFNVLPGGFIQNINGLGGPGCDLLHVATTVADVSQTTLNTYAGGTGPNAVTINATPSVGTFAGIERIEGDAGRDTFVVTGTGGLDSGIFGAGNEDTITLSTYANAITVNVNGINNGDILDPTLGTPNFLNQGLLCPPGPNAFNAIENVVGTQQADTFNLGDGDQLTGTVGIDGQGPVFAPAFPTTAASIGDRINATHTSAVNFNVTGIDSGALTSPAPAPTNFRNIETLSGTAFNDSFNVSPGARMANLLGNAGSDTFANNGLVGVIDGGTGNDNINIGQTGVVTVMVDGGADAGAPCDTMSVERAAGATHFINGPNSGTVGTGGGTTNVVNAFQNVENLNGGSGNDTFLVNQTTGGSLSGGVNGQGGTDTLQVTNTAGGAGAAFVVSGTNSGDLRNFTYTYPANGKTPILGTLILNTGACATQGFSSTENLVGGAADDLFRYLANGQTTGQIDGRGNTAPASTTSVANPAGTNTIVPRGDILDLRAKSPVVNVIVTGLGTGGAGGTDGYHGTAATGGTTPFTFAGNQFLNINSIIGAGAGSVFTNGSTEAARAHIDDRTGNYDTQFRFDSSTTQLLQLLCFDTFNAGSAGDIYGVENLGPGRPIFINGNAANDRVIVGTPFDSVTENVEDLYNTGLGDLDNIQSVVTVTGGDGNDQVQADDSGSTLGGPANPYWYDVTDQSIVNSVNTYDLCCANPLNATPGPGGRPFAGLLYNQTGYSVETVDLAGTQAPNNFYVTPSTNAPDSATFVTINIDGNDPLPGGTEKDCLCVNFAGLTGKALVGWDPATGSGSWTFANAGNVNFVDIEMVKYFAVLAAAAETGVNATGFVNLYDADTGELALPFNVINAYPGFKGGVRVATGDLNGDGIPEIVTAPGCGIAPIVKVFDGLTGSLVTQFNALSTSNVQRGVSVAIGDINGDGAGDIIVGATKGASTVRVFEGIPGALPNVATAPSLSVTNVFPATFKGGVWVAAGNVWNNPGVDPVNGKRAEILVAMGNGKLPTGAGSRVAILSATTAAADSLTEIGAINALQGFPCGAFVTTAYLGPCAGTADPATVDNRDTIIVSMQQGGSANPLVSRAGNASLANQPGGVVEVYSQPNVPGSNPVYWAAPTFRFQPFPGPGTGQAAHAGTRVQARYIEGYPAPRVVGGVDRRIQFFTTQGQDGRPTNGKAVTRWFGRSNAAGILANVTAAPDAFFANLAINSNGTKPRVGGLVSGLFLG